MKKCLHCERAVDFIAGKGWVHLPERLPYVMQHEVMDDDRLRRYNSGMTHKRSKGCGWVGIQPAEELTIKTDICPKCKAVGELADDHIASPSSEKTFMSKIGDCSFPDKCQKAEWKYCDCACDGANHGIQIKMFKI